VNSQITFDEFFLLSKKAFLYECQSNPNIIYEQGLDEIDESDEEEKELTPEYLVDTEGFLERAKSTYSEKVHAKLLKKEWFKKVDALEMFTDYWSMGRGMNCMPLHNIYIPVTHTIMPKPKMRHYDSADQIGEEFAYRTKEMHTHARARKEHETLKPSPFSPAPP
jgi:hypothetical protein